LDLAKGETREKEGTLKQQLEETAMKLAAFQAENQKLLEMYTNEVCAV
jgi:hypothetical protein